MSLSALNIRGPHHAGERRPGRGTVRTRPGTAAVWGHGAAFNVRENAGALSGLKQRLVNESDQPLFPLSRQVGAAGRARDGRIFLAVPLFAATATDQRSQEARTLFRGSG